MTETNFDDGLVRKLVSMGLAAYLCDKDKDKQILKMARQYQREEEDCKITRSIMERIATFKGRRAEAVHNTIDLLFSGDY